MIGEPKFFICKKCGNQVGMIFSGGGTLVCCGQDMVELTANTVDASAEKHVPVIETNGKTVTVKLGTAPHPMTLEHHIEWIYINTSNGGQRKSLDIAGEAKAVFELAEGEELVSAYAHCNLHGLWMAKA